MIANKYLYQFIITKQEEIEAVEISKNQNNEEVKTTKKQIVDKDVPFRLIKPSRKLFDEAELFYGIKLSEGIKAGLLTRSLIAKRYQNDGGAMSEPEKERYANLYVELFRQQNELQRLQLNLEKIPKEEQEGLISELLINMANTRRSLQEIEMYQSSIFEQTAENRARNQTIMWWALNMCYFSNDNGQTFVPFFGEGNFDEKLAVYDSFEEKDDDFYGYSLKKIAYLISLWYMGKVSTDKEFKELDELFDSSKQKQDLEPKENADANNS